MKFPTILNTDEVPGPALRRKHRQRRRIFAEAVKLFEENGGEEGGGHEKTTIEAIAERSDISVRTFFRYFQSKLDVIYADLPAAMEDHLALTEALLKNCKSPASAIIDATTIQLTQALLDEDDRSRMLRAMTSPAFLERRGSFRVEWRNRLSDLILPYLPKSRRNTICARAIASSALDAREAAIENWADTGGKDDLLEIFDQMLAAWRTVWSKDMPKTVDRTLDCRIAQQADEKADSGD